MMDRRIVKSLVTLVAVIALGVGVTFAAFTSNTATISASSLTTGDANIKLCNSDGDDQWKNLISPALSLSDLVPGDTDKDLTAGVDIYLGNDSGDLTDNIADECNTYGDTAGSSDVELSMVPTISNIVCDNANLDDQFKVKFQIGSDQTGYLSLAQWSGNTSTVLPVFSIDESNQVKIFAELDSSATDQNANCTFDISFVGQQSV